MCGIVGLLGKDLVLSDKKVLMDLIRIDSLRGEDSVGVATIMSYKKPRIVNGEAVTSGVFVEKQLGNGFDFINTKMGETFVETGSQFFIAHNRAATIGNVNIENAHPFTYGKITGVHNGTLFSTTTIKDFKSFDVDSKAIINSINLYGVEETYLNLRGAACVVYWDDSEKTLNMFRNAERPMYVAMESDGKKMFYGSESNMLKLAIERGRSAGKFSIKSIEEHTLYTFKVEADGKIQISEKPLKEAVTVYSSSNVYSNTYYDSLYKDDDDLPFNVTQNKGVGVSKGILGSYARVCVCSASKHGGYIEVEGEVLDCEPALDYSRFIMRVSTSLLATYSKGVGGESSEDAFLKMFNNNDIFIGCVQDYKVENGVKTLVLSYKDITPDVDQNF